MRVKVNIALRGKDVVLMHKNAREVFSEYIYTFMVQHECSRTKEELNSISTDELLKDMWYLGVSPDSVVFITDMDYETLNAMLYNINRCGGEEVDLVNLFHEYVQMRMDSDEWDNV